MSLSVSIDSVVTTVVSDSQPLKPKMSEKRASESRGR